MTMSYFHGVSSPFGGGSPRTAKPKVRTVRPAPAQAKKPPRVVEKPTAKIARKPQVKAVIERVTLGVDEFKKIQAAAGWPDPKTSDNKSMTTIAGRRVFPGIAMEFQVLANEGGPHGRQVAFVLKGGPLDRPVGAPGERRQLLR